MMGERIRQGRLVAGLTLDETVQRLADSGVAISKQGLSNYEKNKRTPKAAVLMSLAKAFSVKAEYFLDQSPVTIEWTAYRCQSRLLKRQKEEIEAVAQSVAEKQMYLQSTLFPEQRPDFPTPMKARSGKDAENTASKLREAWKLGTDALESLTQIIESKGAVLVEHPMDGVKFDGLSGWINGIFPVLVVNSKVPTDRLRFDLAHELGHLVMDCGSMDAKKEENLAHRFAGAFLAPADTVRMELGERRKTIDLQELALLKQKYGLSMQGFISRAQQLGIVADAECKRMWMKFSRLGWRKKEPVDYNGDETPTRLTQMAMHALAEGIIPEEKAREFLPREKLSDSTTNGADEGPPPKARELLRMPRKERLRLLAKATSDAQDIYKGNPDLTEWDDLGMEDLHE